MMCGVHSPTAAIPGPRHHLIWSTMDKQPPLYKRAIRAVGGTSAARRRSAQTALATRWSKPGPEKDPERVASGAAQCVRAFCQALPAHIHLIFSSRLNPIHAPISPPKQSTSSPEKSALRRESRAKNMARSLREKLGFAKKDGAQARKMAESTQDQLGQAHEQVDQLQADLSQSHAENQVLKRTISQMSLTVESSSKKISKLEHSLGDVQANNVRLQKEKDALLKQVKRWDGRLQSAKAKAAAQVQATAKAVRMKVQGAFTEKFQALYRKLIDRGVAYKHVDGVVHDVAETLDIDVQDHVDARTVGRADAEGLVQSRLQIASELAQSSSES
jgi:regulator of replication initiation timing